MALPTFSQIVQSMITFLQGSRPDIATQTGSVVNDVVISTVANQLSAENGTDQSVYSSIQYTQNLQAFVINADTILPADLDAIGNNYGMTRLPGTQATGTLLLRIRNYTTSSPIITVPAGTTVSTLSTTTTPAVSFATTATVTFTPSLAPFYYDPVSGFYQQAVGIICQTIGTVGNVGSNTITSLTGPGSGIDAVTNTVATSGGTNIESNVSFAGRIQIKLEGNNVGTPNGIISLIDTNPNVIQSIIVGPNDPTLLRNQYGGSANVYIRGQVPVTLNDTFTYSTTASQQYTMINQPVLSVGSVTGIVNSTPYTFVPGTDYQFVLNPNLLLAGSVDAGSYIDFNVTTSFTIITVGLPFTVTTVSDAIHLIVSSTAGMNPGDTITQSPYSTTITSVDSATQLTVASTSNWVGGSAPAIDITVPQLIVNTTSGMNIGNDVIQGAFTTTISSIPNSTTIVVASTNGFGSGVAYFSGFNPDNNTVVTINYTYDSLIPTLQALLDSNSNHIVASDILVIEASQALIDITASILVVPGYVPATVVTNVNTALSDYINNLGLGAVIILSEIAAIIQEVPGVAEVDLSTLTIQSTIDGVPTVIPPGQQISIGKQAYSVASSLVITVES